MTKTTAEDELGPYALFGTDEDVEKDGLWLDYSSKFRIKIARAGGSNRKFSQLLDAKLKPYKRLIDMDKMDEEVLKNVLIDVFASTVVLDWKGVTDRAGKAMAFNKENVIKLFNDLPDLFADVRKSAMNASLFRKELAEAEAGNS